MYSNNLLNFQESMTILNASTKKSGNLLNASRKLFVCTQFKCQTVLSNTQIGSYQVPPLWIRVDLGVIANGVFHILQSVSITGASPSDCSVSYPRTSLGYPSAEMQSVYSTAPINWAKENDCRTRTH